MVNEHAHRDLRLGQQRRWCATPRNPGPIPRGSALAAWVRQQVCRDAVRVRVWVAIPHDTRRATYEHGPASRVPTCAPVPPFRFAEHLSHRFFLITRPAALSPRET